MAAYVVMEPPRASGAESGVQAQFVRDGFWLLAFIAPLPWLLWYRLWLAAVLTLLAAAAIAVLGNLSELGPALPALSLLVSFYVAIEGSAIRLARLRRLGWREAATIEANSRAEAEIRYFSSPPNQQSSEALKKPAIVPHGSRPGATTGPALGLLEYPGN